MPSSVPGICRANWYVFSTRGLSAKNDAGITVSPMLPASGRGGGCEGPADERPVSRTPRRATPETPVMIHGKADVERRAGSFLLAMRDARRRRLHCAELGQHVRAIEQTDVLGLHRRELSNRPGEVNEVRLEGVPEGRHPAFLR